MKKLFFSLLLILTPVAFCFAQGNLQFNQVIFYDITWGNTQAFTVPAGKVWKLESVGASMTSCNVYQQNSAGQTIGIIYAVSTSSINPTLPIWFPSSHSGFFAYNINNCTGAHAYISIIEFNVVP